ncbi:Nif3-like dinuclear metal center hexameric protein [[Mycoplasma] mobile]|uniref:GTP cyclohydrolase 1 type 2 homolog n=1 Tax=Mycoplasma mobile (strain ATCC 43663 / 163K / NCTC 11711) TaxID=267748 RepID=Q6KI02_MYCM1|nr:Nif3-like dinuclear metal center hexameric protein [[Mycoplasma] mobile]AAT27774.1 expressed protein [Mycoplasma mobile 163K]
MIKKVDLINYLESFYPFEKAELWDKVGFSFLSKNLKQIKKILICLDFDFEAFEKVMKNDIDLIITHHPFYFEDTLEEEFLKNPYKSKIESVFKKLNNKSIYTLHTNFDNHFEGTSYLIAEQLGYTNFLKTNNNQAVITKVNENFKDIVDKIKSSFNFTYVISNLKETDEIVKTKKTWKIAIFAGAGDINLINQFKDNYDFDLLITSDLKWNTLISLASNQKEINYLIVPHKIEEVFIAKIETLLKEKFSNKLEIFTYYSKVDNFSY